MHKSQYWSLPSGIERKVVPVHATKTSSRSRGIVPVIHNVDYVEVIGQ